MNKRIEDLIKQATIRVNEPTVNSSGKVICDNWEEGVSLSKFAELIVRDCTRTIRNTDLEDVQGGDSSVLNAAAEQVNKYFGIE